MTAVRAHRWASSTALAALLLSVLATLVAIPSSQARLVPVELSFSHMLPGEERSSSVEVHLPRDARLTDAVVAEANDHASAFVWDLSLCATTGDCVRLVPASGGAELAAGAHTLDVTVRLDGDAPAGSRSTLSGHLVLADARDGLPLTGMGPGLLLVAAGLLVVGSVLFALARREAEEAPDA